jgi:hypothetical protein
MIRKFKTFGPTLLAVFAMSAVVPSAVQATSETLTTFPGGSSAIPTGEQVGENALTLTDHEVEPGQFATSKCKKATFTGTEPLPEGLETILAHPEFKECTAFGQPATITTTGCDYLFHIGSPTSGGRHATKDIVCSAGATIKIVTGTCEVTIGSQNGLTTSEVTNSGTEEAMDLLLHTNITGIKYTVVKDGVGCPLIGKGEFSKGDYTGTTTVKAHDSSSGEPVGITVEGEQ